MALPRKYQNESDIPVQFREHYVMDPQSGEWLLALEGDDQPNPKVTRLIQSERAQRLEATQKVKELEERFQGIDPQQAKEALEKMAELAEAQEMSGKKAEEQAQRKFERQIQQMQGQINQLVEQNRHESAKYTTLRERYSSVVMNDRLLQAAIAAGADPSKAKFLVQEALPTWQLPEDADEPQPQDSEGNVIYGADAARPLTMVEQMRGLLKEYPFLGLQSTGAGTQQRPAGTPLNGAIQLTQQQAKNFTTYRNAKAQAEKMGVGLDILPE